MSPARAAPAFRIHLKIEPAYARRAPAPLLRAAARAALTHSGARAPSDLTIMITGDRALQALNLQFLGHDWPTDVLSFPSGEVDPATGRIYLGDIAISFPQAAAGAARGGHPVKAELQLLIVHGVLHLLGHDHGKKAEKSRMWAAQAAILTALGAAITGPAGD